MSKKKHDDELAQLILARMDAAKESGEELSEEDVMQEFGVTEQELSGLNAGSQNICCLLGFACCGSR